MTVVSVTFLKYCIHGYVEELCGRVGGLLHAFVKRALMYTLIWHRVVLCNSHSLHSLARAFISPMKTKKWLWLEISIVQMPASCTRMVYWDMSESNDDAFLLSRLGSKMRSRDY